MEAHVQPPVPEYMAQFRIDVAGAWVIALKEPSVSNL
jgi:hypothetical protein